MQEGMGGRDAAYLRRWVMEQYQHRGQGAAPVDPQEVIEAGVDHLQPLEDLELESLVRVLLKQACDAASRSRSRGVRRLERAQGVDVPAEQLLIPQLEAVAERKIAHGRASVREGMRDLAVHGAALHIALTRGLEPAKTHVGDVLAAAEIARIRAQFDDLADAA